MVFLAAERRGSSVKRDKPSPTFGEENEQKSKRQCQAGNPHCLLTKAKDTGSESLGTLACHICCSEPGFCRECKCVLCCKFFAPDADDFSIIRCLNSPTSGLGICGHAAHLECALDSQLAGVIKKIGLDMEYMCRRCDRKTDLKETVSRLVSEFMNKTATESKVENSLQLLLRVVQDPEDEARNAGKLQTTLLAALKKVMHHIPSLVSRPATGFVESWTREVVGSIYIHRELQLDLRTDLKRVYFVLVFLIFELHLTRMLAGTRGS